MCLVVGESGVRGTKEWKQGEACVNVPFGCSAFFKTSFWCYLNRCFFSNWRFCFSHHVGEVFCSGFPSFQVSFPFFSPFPSLNLCLFPVFDSMFGVYLVAILAETES